MLLVALVKKQSPHDTRNLKECKREDWQWLHVCILEWKTDSWDRAKQHLRPLLPRSLLATITVTK